MNIQLLGLTISVLGETLFVLIENGAEWPPEVVWML
jgi:hypothetical protein